MYGTMLSDDSSTVNTYYLSVRERQLNLFHRPFVLFGLVISRNEDSVVENKEVGVCRWQPLAIIVDSLWHGEWQ